MSEETKTEEILNTGEIPESECEKAAETETEKAETEDSVTNTADEAKPKPLVYIGPTIPGKLRYSTTFKGGVLSKGAAECIGKYPAMRKLFVTTDALPDAVKELKKERSALKSIYLRAASRQF